MSYSENIVIERAFDEFLRIACEMAQGDIDKGINISKIWKELKMKGISEQEYAPKIVRLLKDNHLIRSGDNEDEIRITYDGIYYVVDKLKVPAENLGVLPYHELNRYLDPFLDVLYQETTGDASKSVSIHDIKKKRFNALGQSPIRQISEFLKMKGLIETGENIDTVKLPSKHIKKPYEAPSRF